jgi:hypothetical protein
VAISPSCGRTATPAATSSSRRTGLQLNYSTVKGAIGQQYTDGQAKWGVPTLGGKALPSHVAPFGACDHNVFPGVSNGAQFRALWGRPAYAATPIVKPAPKPVVKPTPKPAPKPTPAPAPKPKPAVHKHYPHGVYKTHDHALVSTDGRYAAVLEGGRIHVRDNGHTIHTL